MSQITKELLARELLDRELRGGELSALNSLLDGEITAVETYNEAIQKIQDTTLIPSLEECRNSHASRVQVLRDRIAELGGTAHDGSGIWGTLAMLVENTAVMFGDQATIAVLAGGEAYGTQQYKDNLESLDSHSRQVVKKELLPAQRATRDLARHLSVIAHGYEQPRTH